MQRRHFLVTSPALTLSAAAGPVLAAPAIISSQSPILPRRARGHAS